MSNPMDIIKQLNSARDIALRDPAIYPQIVPGVLPVIAAAQAVQLRRWGADFLAETFASPVLGADVKQQMCLQVLDTLKSYLNRKEEHGEEEDSAVLKSAVQCAASIYPHIFSHTISHAEDTESWGKMATIKSSILRRMDNTTSGVHICCLKFVARVVQVQTPGLISDPRRPEQNEVSLALVPRDHATIPPSNLEAEASGLLDRLLGVFEDQSVDPLIVTATLNALSVIVHRRASISSKVLSTVLTFNPLKLSERHMSGRDKVATRSMARTTISFLVNFAKRNPNHALAARTHQQAERLRHGLTDAFSEHHGKKRPAPEEPTDGLDDAKRQRIETEVANGDNALQAVPVTVPEQLPPGLITYSQLYTLTSDKLATGFDVKSIPESFISQLVPAVLAALDQSRMSNAIISVQRRYLDVSQRQAPPSAISAAHKISGLDEDEDYDPASEFAGEAALNRLDQLPPEAVAADDLAIGPFNLPPSSPLTEQERSECNAQALSRVFDVLGKFDVAVKTQPKKQTHEKGFNRAINAGHDRDGWVTLLLRLATRSGFELDPEVEIKSEDEERALAKKTSGHFDLPYKIRDTLHKYVTDDFRKRIDVAIAWLNEEWFCDKLAQQLHPDSTDKAGLPNYTAALLKLLDSLEPYLDKQDFRVVIRLLSEVPSLNVQVFDWVRRVANDPERVDLAVKVLLYITMLKPPARDMAVDSAEKLWNENSDAKKKVEAVLKKWRPQVLEQAKAETPAEVKAES